MNSPYLEAGAIDGDVLSPVEVQKVTSDNHIFTRLKIAEINEIDAGYRKFAIIFVKGLQNNGVICNGVTDFDSCTIYLELMADPDKAHETVLHEIMHIVCKTVGLDWRYFPEGEEDTVSVSNEHMVTQITKGLMLLDKLNPGLMEVLFPQDYDEPEELDSDESKSG